MRNLLSMRLHFGLFTILLLLTAGILSLFAETRLELSVSAASDKAATSDNIVRVGWYNSDHFQEGASDDEIRSGYSYEYLQSIANYTGWNYEYVYGGWSDLYDAFVAGDIDLLAGVSYTEARASIINYPSTEMGFESYYIYKKAGNDDIAGGDLSTLTGRKIGTIQNNLMTTYFESWKNETGIDCQEVLFDDFQTRDEAFERGDIDAFIAVNNNVPANSGYSPVVMVGRDSYYLAVTKSRTDLLDELNAALSTITESNPYFTESLQIKYFQNTAVNAALTPAEIDWVREHGSLKVGYVSNYMPFCGPGEDGQASGVVTDIMESWMDELGLQDQLSVEYIEYPSYKSLVEGLQNDDIDCAFPVSDSIWISEQEHVVQTNNLVESAVYLIYKGEYNEHSTDIIAISDHSPFQRGFTRLNYPDSEIYLTDGAEGCLAAVKSGKATCTFFNSGRAEQLLDSNEYESLNRISLGTNINYCLGVKKGNSIVYSLLERGVGLIDKSAMTGEMYKYVNIGNHYSLGDFIKDNMALVMTVIAVIIGLVVLVAVILAISLRRSRIQNEKEQRMLEITRHQNEELELTKTHLEEAVQKAETASKAKTTFLFNMSHDIRTPMNAILGFAHLAKEDAGNEQVITDYLGKIEDSGEILLSILNNVLEMSRIEKGTLVLEEHPEEIRSFYKKLLTVFDEQMKQKGITFENSINVEHPYLHCDATKLREIFLNILSNAYKFTEAGGTVSVRIDELPSDESSTVSLRTTIADTGKGISETFLPTLFEEFSREKNSTMNTIEGSGLGLAIVKNLVDLMNGTVEVTSKEGQGTTFTVTIPHKIASGDETKDLKNNTEPKTYNFAGKRILLAEDMDVNARIATAVLERAEFKVERAKDGQICVDMLKEKPAGYYDAILMDIQMPNLNGYEATRAIRAMDDKDKSGIPIIAITANAFEEDRQNAFASGMNGHLGKPIVIPDLLKTLDEFLD